MNSVTMAPREVAPWEAVYGLKSDDLSQYQPLIDEAAVGRIRIAFDETPVGAPPGPLGLMVDAGSVGVTVDHDGQGHLSLDRIADDTARIRPLSYLLHTRCFRALDVPQVLALGQKDKHATLRKRLTEFGKPHKPDSDLFPCKLGMTGLIVERKAGVSTAILTTRRAEDLAIYSGLRHSSFSGGVEVSELAGQAQSLSDLIARAAMRECREELGLAIPPSDFRVLGVWRDLHRLSAQAFVMFFVENRESLSPKPNHELSEWRFERPQRGWTVRLWERLRGRSDESPELRMFRRLLARGVI